MPKETSCPKCKTATISILPKWPYEVCGNVPIRQEKMTVGEHGGSDEREQGKEYVHEEITHLCRCWHSQNKPFCDGTHVKIGFEGTEYATKEEYQEGALFYQGAELWLLDKEKYCAVARFCHRGNGTRQDTKDSADPEAKERAIHSASNCPWRLTAVDKEGNLIEPVLAPEIWIVEDLGKDRKGPLFVQGGIEIESSDGVSYPIRNRQALCRCGQSRNMPFCDASHLNCEHMKGIDQ